MADPTDPPGSGPRAARTVLVAEDDPDSRENLRQLLEGLGHAVLAAADGREALALLRAGPPPDLILLDPVMPAVDGREFRRLQAADPALSGIPVVVLTGLDEAD